MDEEKAAIVTRDVRPRRETSTLQDEIGKKQLQGTVESRAASVEESLAIPLPTFSATQFTFDISQLFPFHQFTDLGFKRAATIFPYRNKPGVRGFEAFKRRRKSRQCGVGDCAINVFAASWAFFGDCWWLSPFRRNRVFIVFVRETEFPVDFGSARCARNERSGKSSH